MAKVSTKQLYNKALTLGTGSDKIQLDRSEVFSLLHIALGDLGWDHSKFKLESIEGGVPDGGYFSIDFNWFQGHEIQIVTDLLEVFDGIVNYDSDFGLYFLNLCALHKRRFKYQRILSTQPRPTMEQIGPRGLLEFGLSDGKLLANWMLWRKWIFDIDNRSGQETGYLFEPILSSSLGGLSLSSTKSPVSRIDANGNKIKGNRQVDCYIADENLAYEFKLRVTIAASGQGRFGEELSFPRECKAAGIIPVLLVLDSTPNPRLKELEAAFISSGGKSYVGEDAWNHMEEKSGKVISSFIKRYIKIPLLAIADAESEDISDMYLTWSKQMISVSDGKSTYNVKRSV